MLKETRAGVLGAVSACCSRAAARCAGAGQRAAAAAAARCAACPRLTCSRPCVFLPGLPALSARQVGDKIVSAKVVAGGENLVAPK